ncbi:IclR family transcriptional regulator [Geodermatophilus sp. CPCC 206100]|uniref:IclR family transcriptional regulator n=1 Tax=Geodermatophilus sp. CPCC 206100 TaxID=3020054 RepID=UPI003B001572
MTAPGDTRSRDNLLARAVRIIEAFDAGHASLPVSAVARRTGLPVPTTYRLVGELLQLGLLERGADRRVRVGVRLWELASRSAEATTLREAAMPFMDDLHAAVRQHTQLGVLDGEDVLYVERKSALGADVPNITRTASRLPAFACSSGLVLLAHASPATQERVLAAPRRVYTPLTVTDAGELRRHLAEARYRGYAVVRGWVHEQTAGVAVPVWGPDNTVLAALAVLIDNESARVATVLPVLLATARGISRALGAQPPPLAPVADECDPTGG